MKNKENELVMHYINAKDCERASFMYVLVHGLSWDKEDIGRIYNFDGERLDIDGIENYLSYASNGESKCIKLATILFNGGAYFSPDELKLNRLLSGLDDKHLSACLDAMELRYGSVSRFLEKKNQMEKQKKSSFER